MNKRGMGLISKALRKAEAALEEAVEIADDHGIQFSWMPPGVEGKSTYHPDEWSSSSGCEWESSEYIEGYWESSSETC